jgi:AbiJ-like protein/TIR domain-containing protein
MSITRKTEPQPNRITDLTRRDIVDALLMDQPEFHGRLDLISFLKRVWPLQQMPSEDHRFKNAEGDIWQHIVNNSDWNESELLYRRLGICEIPDGQFVKFVEAAVHPLVLPEPKDIANRVAMLNDSLKNDGFVLRSTSKLSGRPIYKVTRTSTEVDGIAQAYEVVLSFAGEDRAYVEKVAETLKTNGVSLFYDDYEESSLWGKNLVEHFQKVYGGSARYCVMFISKHYAEKVWPTHERRSAFQKAIEAKEEYILPARFDDTEIPGLHRTVGYVDLRKKSACDLASLILQKLGRQQIDFTLEDDIPF